MRHTTHVHTTSDAHTQEAPRFGLRARRVRRLNGGAAPSTGSGVICDLQFVLQPGTWPSSALSR